jgi:hypothetical protein
LYAKPTRPQESIETFEESVISSGSKGIIMSKMIHECGGRAGFEDAKARGDVWEVVGANGKSLWYSNEEEEKDTRGVKERTKLHAGQRKVNAKDAPAMRAASPGNISIHINVLIVF